ncbi:MAG: hypothetical protein AAF225_03970 [Pseudomonadota bacterium]
MLKVLLLLITANEMYVVEVFAPAQCEVLRAGTSSQFSMNHAALTEACSKDAACRSAATDYFVDFKFPASSPGQDNQSLVFKVPQVGACQIRREKADVIEVQETIVQNRTNIPCPDVGVVAGADECKN